MSEALEAAKKAFVTDMEDTKSMTEDEIEAVVSGLNLAEQQEFADFMMAWTFENLGKRIRYSDAETQSATKH